MSDDIRYEDEKCKRFNESLDEEGKIEIASIPFQHSRILYELAYDTYKDAFEEFQEQDFEYLKQIVFDEYPACIAYNFRLSERGEGATDPVWKLLHLKDTWEAITFVLYALVMGEVRHKKIDLKIAQAFVSQGTTGSPLYINFNTDRILSDAIKQRLCNIKGLIRFCKTNSLGFKFQEIEENLIDDLLALQDIRNDISHTASPTREQAETELKQVIPLFMTMLNKTRFLENCKFLRFDTYGANCRCETFNGHSLNREFDGFEFPDPQKAYVLGLGQEQLFVEWDLEWFSLSPFLHFDRDTTGHESYICYYKGKKESKYWYEPVKMRGKKTFDHLQARFEAEKDELIRLLVP